MNRRKIFRTSRGFTYTALLAAIVIIGITLGSASKYWSSLMARDREEELLFRGNQYRMAIQKYMTAIPGRIQYPESIDALLKDSRSPDGKRHLRQKFKDPITGEDFVLIIEPLSRRIIGVHSSSEKEPIKKSNFAIENRDFEGKTKYNEWLFQAVAPGQIQQPGAVPYNPAAPPVPDSLVNPQNQGGQPK